MAIDKHKRRVFRGNLDPMGTMRTIHTALIPVEVEIEDLKAPGYFWPVAGRVQPFDHIEASWEDGSRVVIFRVMEKDERANTLLLVVDSEKEYPAPKLPAGYELEFVNKAAGWRVIHADRKTPLRGGFASALSAAQWLSNDLPQEGAAGAGKGAKAAEAPRGGKPADPKKAADADATA